MKPLQCLNDVQGNAGASRIPVQPLLLVCRARGAQVLALEGNPERPLRASCHAGLADTVIAEDICQETNIIDGTHAAAAAVSPSLCQQKAMSGTASQAAHGHAGAC